MRITAKHRGVCPMCQRWINIGDAIDWDPGMKAVHASCVGGNGGITSRAIGEHPERPECPECGNQHTKDGCYGGFHPDDDYGPGPWGDS